MSNTIEMAQRGQITLPKVLRAKYGWKPGQTFNLLDIDGVLFLCAADSGLMALANRLRDDILADGGSLEEMLAELRQIRENRQNTETEK